MSVAPTHVSLVYESDRAYATEAGSFQDLPVDENDRGE